MFDDKDNTLKWLVGSVAGLVVFAVVLTLGFREPDVSDENIIATYSDGVVTLADVQALLDEQGSAASYSSLDLKQRKNLVASAALRKIIDVQAEDADFEDYPPIKARVEAYERELMRREWPAYAAQQAVTDQEVKERYGVLTKQLEGQEERFVRHILTKTQKQAQVVHKALKAGEDFTTLVQQKSLDSASKGRGGSLGWVTKGQFVKPFDEVVFAMKKGQLSKPVKTEFGWHIIELQDMRPVKVAEFKDVKDRIRQELGKAKTKTYVSELLENAKVTLRPLE